MKTHQYALTTKWTGNLGAGTENYRGYERSHTIEIDGKQLIEGSSDPSFRGDKTKYNPEELLLAALSSCHMLAYLHVCVTKGVVVTSYTDKAKGEMKETPDGGGHFTSVVLNPVVTVKHTSMIEAASAAHHEANKLCFIANSVNFPITHTAEISEQEQDEVR